MPEDAAGSLRARAALGHVKTARVRLESDVTIGLGAVIDIGVTVGDGCLVGALSLVPKHMTLEPGGVYAGIPVQRIDRHTPVATRSSISAPSSSAS